MTKASKMHGEPYCGYSNAYSARFQPDNITKTRNENMPSFSRLFSVLKYITKALAVIFFGGFCSNLTSTRIFFSYGSSNSQMFIPSIYSAFLRGYKYTVQHLSQQIVRIYNNVPLRVLLAIHVKATQWVLLKIFSGIWGFLDDFLQGCGILAVITGYILSLASRIFKYTHNRYFRNFCNTKRGSLDDFLQGCGNFAIITGYILNLPRRMVKYTHNRYFRNFSNIRIFGAENLGPGFVFNQQKMRERGESATVVSLSKFLFFRIFRAEEIGSCISDSWIQLFQFRRLLEFVEYLYTFIRQWSALKVQTDPQSKIPGRWDRPITISEIRESLNTYPSKKRLFCLSTSFIHIAFIINNVVANDRYAVKLHNRQVYFHIDSTTTEIRPDAGFTDLDIFLKTNDMKNRDILYLTLQKDKKLAITALKDRLILQRLNGTQFQKFTLDQRKNNTDNVFSLRIMDRCVTHDQVNDRFVLRVCDKDSSQQMFSFISISQLESVDGKNQCPMILRNLTSSKVPWIPRLRPNMESLMNDNCIVPSFREELMKTSLSGQAPYFGMYESECSVRSSGLGSDLINSPNSRDQVARGPFPRKLEAFPRNGAPVNSMNILSHRLHEIPMSGRNQNETGFERNQDQIYRQNRRVRKNSHRHKKTESSIRSRINHKTQDMVEDDYGSDQGIGYRLFDRIIPDVGESDEYYDLKIPVRRNKAWTSDMRISGTCLIHNSSNHASKGTDLLDDAFYRTDLAEHSTKRPFDQRMSGEGFDNDLLDVHSISTCSKDQGLSQRHFDDNSCIQSKINAFEPGLMTLRSKVLASLSPQDQIMMYREDNPTLELNNINMEPETVTLGNYLKSLNESVSKRIDCGMLSKDLRMANIILNDPNFKNGFYSDKTELRTDMKIPTLRTNAEKIIKHIFSERVWCSLTPKKQTHKIKAQIDLLALCLLRILAFLNRLHDSVQE